MFENLAKAKMPVLLWSGGLDSTLILAMLREQPIDFSIVQSRDHWTREQRKRTDDLIKLWDLKVFSYPPIHTNLIGDGKHIAAVFEYAIGGTKTLIIKDILEGEKCYHELDGMRMPESPFDFDFVIIGSRKDDRHWSLNRDVIPAKEWQSNGVTFYAPLYEWNRSMVKEGLRSRGLDDSEVADAEDTGNLELCTRCLHGKETYCPKVEAVIPPVNWSARANLALFRLAA